MRWIDRSCLSTLLPSCLSLPLSFILRVCLCVCHLLATKVSHCVVWLVIYLCFLLCCRAHFGANLKVGVSQIPNKTATEPEEEGAAETAASARGMQTRGKGIRGQGLWGSRAGPLAGNQFAIVTVTVTESPST